MAIATLHAAWWLALLAILAFCEGQAMASGALPVTKVIQLLRDMQAQLEKDAKEDADIWKNLGCWCENNKQEKSKAVEDMQQLVGELESTIERASAGAAGLTEEIAQIESDIKEAELALAQATEIRKKEAAAFHDQEVDLTSGIELLRGAITALSEHHAAMLQGQASQQLKALRPVLRRLVYKHLPLLGWMRASHDKEVFLRFLDAHPDILEPDLPQLGFQSFLAERRSAAQSPFRSYSPQSGQILGMLKQMKESFEEDLPVIQAEEMRKANNFAALKGAKEAGLTQYRESLAEKKAGVADAKEDAANAKNDLEDTKASLGADQRFLLQLTGRCAEGESEWERRSKARTEEIAAVSEAVQILSQDAVKDGQQRAFNASFLQLAQQSGRSESRRTRAHLVELLSRRLSNVTGASEMALLSALKEDPFSKIGLVIDGLIAKLQVEQGDEVKHRDFCIGELHESEVQLARKTMDLANVNATANALVSRVEALSAEVKELETEIDDMQVAQQGAAVIRKRENLEFQKARADTLVMKRALEQAYAKLASVYVKKQTLVQVAPEPASKNDTTPWGTITSAPKFDGYKKSGGSSHVLALLQTLIGEAAVFDDNAVHDEQGAQDAYVKLVSETTESIKAITRLMADKREERAAASEELHATELDLSKITSAIEALGTMEAQLHDQCDWLIKNFAARQEARASEMSALREVKALIRGMVPD